MSLEQRHEELGRRESYAMSQGDLKLAVRLSRKRDAARRKARLRGEEWVDDYYSKPN